VIAIVDAVNFNGYKDLSVTAQNQTKFTDLIIFNKIELADLQQKKAVVGYVRELNSHSPIIEAPKGKVESEIVFGLNSTELEKLLLQSHETHQDHIHEDEIKAFSLSPGGVISLPEMENFLQNLPKNIFRAKGFITTNKDEIYIFNTVGGRSSFAKVPENFKTKNSKNLLVFIGYHVNEYEDEVNNKLRVLLI
jgi:G3E family GTPase